MGYLICYFLKMTATTEIYTLPLHDALPICARRRRAEERRIRLAAAATVQARGRAAHPAAARAGAAARSEEHTSELQSRQYLVCRLLLEKKRFRLDPGLARACITGPPPRRCL